ncbi:MAG: hypothetical protein RLZZ182_2432 [Pseudomonadota bacterium]|jgi:hypothetical protein
MTRLDFVCSVLHLSLLTCLLCQAAIDPSYENFVPTVMSCASIAVLVQYIWSSRPFDDTPLSALALLGYAVTSQAAALLSQTFQWLPYTHMLRAPMTTFAVLSSVMLLAVAVHYAYRRFQPLHAWRDLASRSLLSDWGLYDVPRPTFIWAVSSLGLLSAYSGSAGTGDVGGKALQAMEFLAWMPYLILVYHRRFGRAYCDLRVQLPAVALYALVLVVVGMSRNSRQLMLMGPVIALLMYFTVVIRERSAMPIRSVSKILVGLVLSGFMVALMADLATAMVLAREKREGATPREMIEETYHALLDRNRIQAFREASYLAAITDRYDEHYLSNPLLARLSETKFHDNMFYLGLQFTDRERQEVVDETLVRFVTLLPQPAIEFLNLKIRKDKYAYSIGDVYISEALGLDMGSFVTGSIWADAVVIFGPYAPLAAMAVLWFSFWVIDLFSRLDSGYFISPVGLCMAWTIFLYGLGSESFVSKVAMLARELPQRLVLYLMLYNAIRFFRPSMRFTGQTLPQSA